MKFSHHFLPIHYHPIVLWSRSLRWTVPTQVRVNYLTFSKQKLPRSQYTPHQTHFFCYVCCFCFFSLNGREKQNLFWYNMRWKKPSILPCFFIFGSFLSVSPPPTSFPMSFSEGFQSLSSRRGRMKVTVFWSMFALNGIKILEEKGSIIIYPNPLKP